MARCKLFSLKKNWRAGRGLILRMSMERGKTKWLILFYIIRSVDRAGNSLSFAVLQAKILYGQHLLRQTRRPKPKADDVLNVENVGNLLSDTVESTFTQLPLPL